MITAEVFFFAIVATVVTFALVFKFATSVPIIRKRTFKSNNWGAYTNTNSKSAPLAPPTAAMPRR